MSWENVNLAEISPDQEAIAVGNYTFQILGGKYDDNEPGKVLASAAVASEGDAKGRKITFSYPDPNGVNKKSGKKQDWSARVFKSLVLALGVDVMPGEDPVAYLNRVKGFNFGGTIKQRSYEKDGVKKTAADLDIFNVRAAA